MNSGNYCGRVYSGSVSDGVRVYLNVDENIEMYPVGALLGVEGSSRNYLGLIVDVGMDPTVLAQTIISPLVSEDIKRVFIEDRDVHTRTPWVQLVLVAQSSGGSPRLADTIPEFGSRAVEPTEDVLREFFGVEDRIEMWNIGAPKTPRGIGVEIPINVESLTRLSFGIFGKSGTGKTFLGNLIASYIVLYDLQKGERDKRIRLLIFDMHSEYALRLVDDMQNPIADGVALIFKEEFRRFTPDEEYVKTYGLEPLRINYNKLTPSDIEIIGRYFGVSSTFIQHLRTIKSKLSKILGDLWIWGLYLVHEGAVEDLRRRPNGKKLLEKIIARLEKGGGSVNMDSLSNILQKRIGNALGSTVYGSFVTQTSKLRRMFSYPIALDYDPVDVIVDNLLSKDGKHVTISLGKYEKETPLYMLIANMIARRLRERILKKIEQGEELETRIVVFLEEAHNFLGKESYRISPFGDIARELRKKGVILCVIDQRPSELDPDVVGMLWTKFVFALTQSNDINVALLGAPYEQLFRKIVPTLQNRETLIYGLAVKFPVVVRIKDYVKFSKEVLKQIATRRQEDRRIREEMLRHEGLL